MHSDSLVQSLAAHAPGKGGGPLVPIDDGIAVLQMQPKLSPSPHSAYAWIGVNPGRRGAIALLPGSGPAQLVDYHGGARLAGDVLRGWLIDFDVQLVAIEVTSSWSRRVVRPVSAFGRSFGGWLGVLVVLGIPHLLVPPREWQRGLVRPSDGSDPKSRSLAVAHRLFPNVDLSRRKDHHRSDALLLAYWAKRGSRR